MFFHNLTKNIIIVQHKIFVEIKKLFDPKKKILQKNDFAKYFLWKCEEMRLA